MLGGPNGSTEVSGELGLEEGGGCQRGAAGQRMMWAKVWRLDTGGEFGKNSSGA